MQQVTIQNILHIVHMWFKTIAFNSNKLLGEKWNVIEILLPDLFRQEKLTK